MSFTEVVKIEDIKLKDAILLEGLPGVGNVGKLASYWSADIQISKTVRRNMEWPGNMG